MNLCMEQETYLKTFEEFNSFKDVNNISDLDLEPLIAL